MSQHVDNPDENQPEFDEAESDLAESEEESALDAQGRPAPRPSAKKSAADGRPVKHKTPHAAPESVESGASDAARMRRAPGLLASEATSGLKELVDEQKSHREYLKKGGKSGITTDFLKVTIEDGSADGPAATGEARAKHPRDIGDVPAGAQRAESGLGMPAVQNVLDAVYPSKIEQAAGFLQRSLETLNLPESERVAGIARPAEVLESRSQLTRQEQIREALAVTLSEQIMTLDRQCRARYGTGILESIDDPGLVAQATRSALEKCLKGRQEKSSDSFPAPPDSRSAGESRDRFAAAIAETCARLNSLPAAEQTERMEKIEQKLEALRTSRGTSMDSLIDALMETFSPLPARLSSDVSLGPVIGATAGATILKMFGECSGERGEYSFAETGKMSGTLTACIKSLAESVRPADIEAGLQAAETIAAGTADAILARVRASWLKDGAQDTLQQELSRILITAIRGGARLIDEAALASLSERVAAEGREKVIQSLLKDGLASAIEVEAKASLRACIAGLLEQLPETKRGLVPGEDSARAGAAAAPVFAPAGSGANPELGREHAVQDEDSARTVEKTTRRRRTQDTDLRPGKREAEALKDTRERPAVGHARVDEDDKGVQRARARERVKTDREENVRDQLVAALPADAARSAREKPQEREDDRTKNPLDTLPGVSHHAVLLLGKDGRLYVKDMSASGTWVNGRRIPFNQPTPVSPTDVIRLGSKSGPELKLTKRGGRADLQPPGKGAE
ncbi:MAG TPA: FHA domain-containing protein [Candidatus Obscuribacterales bacterium]